MTPSAFLDFLRKFIAEPGNQSPHNRFLGLELVNIERGRAVVRVPYDARLASACRSRPSTCASTTCARPCRKRR
jgi:hypothetical protein